MRKCATCQQWKGEEEFNFRYKALGIRQPSCKDCQHGHQKTFYQTHIEEEKERSRQRRLLAREEAREFIQQYKRSHPCSICGETDPVVLDFDHIHGKGATINQLVRDGVSIERLQVEIGLTQILCSNCHRRKTARERKGW